MSIGLHPTVQLPDECSIKVLSYLNVKEIGGSCLVSKEWRRLASDDKLWKQLFPGVALPAGVSAKEYFKNSYIVNSRTEIKQRITKIADDLPSNEEATFECHFPNNPGCTISVKVGKVSGNSSSVPSTNEKCIFMGTLEGTILREQVHDRICSYSLPAAIPFTQPLHISSPIYCKTVLPPDAEGTENLLFASHIHVTLIQRIRRLAKEAQTQYRNKIIYYGIATTSVAALGVAMYFSAANSDEQS